MLASTGAIAAPVDDWAFEPKLDGWRALVYVDSIVTARTRTGRNATVSLPELTPFADAIAPSEVAPMLPPRSRATVAPMVSTSVSVEADGSTRPDPSAYGASGAGSRQHARAGGLGG